MTEADLDPARDWDNAREDPRPEPNPMRVLRQRLDAAEKSAALWEDTANELKGKLVEAETRLAAALAALKVRT